MKIHEIRISKKMKTVTHNFEGDTAENRCLEINCPYLACCWKKCEGRNSNNNKEKYSVSQLVPQHSWAQVQLPVHNQDQSKVWVTNEAPDHDRSMGKKPDHKGRFYSTMELWGWYQIPTKCFHKLLTSHAEKSLTRLQTKGDFVQVPDKREVIHKNVKAKLCFFSFNLQRESKMWRWFVHVCFGSMCQRNRNSRLHVVESCCNQQSQGERWNQNHW